MTLTHRLNTKIDRRLQPRASEELPQRLQDE